MIKALTVVQLLLIVIAFASVSAGIFSVVWSIIRAACRKVGLTDRYLIVVPGAIFAMPVLLFLITSLDRLDALERACRAEALTSARLAGVTNLRVQKHYDFWTKTYSGSAMYPWISRPYETPKVQLFVDFEKDLRPHSAWVNCVFSKIPNTGEPPQLSLQDVQVDEHGGFAPWILAH